MMFCDGAHREFQDLFHDGGNPTSYPFFGMRIPDLPSRIIVMNICGAVGTSFSRAGPKALRHCSTDSTQTPTGCGGAPTPLSLSHTTTPSSLSPFLSPWPALPPCQYQGFRIRQGQFEFQFPHLTSTTENAIPPTMARKHVTR